MAAHRRLSKPPIIEALADIRAIVSKPREAFEEFAKEFEQDYPTVKRNESVKAEFKVEGGKMLPPAEQTLGFEGVSLVNADESLTVQFRRDGFTVNNLKRYVGGDRLHDETIKLWSKFAKRMEPTAISRLAFRYINQLRLPLEDGVDFAEYLTSTPQLPEELPQSFSQFLSRVVAHPSDETILSVTQRLMPSPQGPLILLDIDVSENRKFSGDLSEIEMAFRTLRNLRNQAFFSLVTEKTVSLYV